MDDVLLKDQDVYYRDGTTFVVALLCLARSGIRRYLESPRRRGGNVVSRETLLKTRSRSSHFASGNTGAEARSQ